MRFLIVVLLVWTGITFAQPLPPSAQEALRRGNKTVVEALLKHPRPFIDQPLWREAINYGLAAKDAAPTQPEPYSYLAKVYGYVKFYGAAWDAFSSFRALGGIPDERQQEQIVELGRTLGYEFFARDEFERALEVYLVAYTYAPDDEELNLQIARSYLGNNRADLASAYLRKLSARQLEDYSRYLETANNQLVYGRDASHAYERGIKQYYLGNSSEALASFAEATRLDPSFQKAQVWAGRVSLELSQPELALPYWQQALALQPNNATLQYFLTLTENQLRWSTEAYTAFAQGMSFYNQGNSDEARTSLERAVSANPSFSDAWAWLGRVAYESADYQRSYEAFGKAKALSKNETYQYFYEASAQQLGIDTVVIGQVATLEQVAPTHVVKRLESAIDNLTTTDESMTKHQETRALETPIPEVALAGVVSVDIPVAEVTLTETFSELPNPFQGNIQNDPVRSEAEATHTLLVHSSYSAEPLVLLNTTYTYERPDVEDSGAVSFFVASEEAQRSWQTPTNYAEGVIYQRLEVSGKPSNEIVTYQLCLVPNDDISVKPTCSHAEELEFKDIGVYESQQPLNEFYQYDNIDWRKGISNLMVILRDENGNPIDTAFARDSGRNLDLYYPMNVRYSVVLVPPGGSFLGWP